MSQSLNIMCAICNEFYKISDTVYSTTVCGHLFHYNCINQWLRRSNTCPQCRTVCDRSRIHRVYLNYGEHTADDEVEVEIEHKVIPMWLPLDEPTNLPGPEEMPQGAIKSGVDADGDDAYVARVYYEDDLLPANYVPKKRGAYAPYGCRGFFLSADVEVLVDSECKWVQCEDGHVPDDALVTGYADSGERLYTGRTLYEGILLPGKVHPSHGVLYMPFNGEEVNRNQYEVLVRVPRVCANAQTNN